MSILILFIVTIIAFVVMKSLAGKDRRLPPASTPEGKRARIIMGPVLATLVGALVFNGMGGDSHAILPSVVIGVSVALIAVIFGLKSGKPGGAMKVRRRVNLTYAYLFGGLGLVTNWAILLLANLRLDQVAKEDISRAESIIVVGGLLVSLVLVVGPTVVIVRRLWPSRNALTPDQKIVAYYALIGFIIAVAMLIKRVSWLSLISAIGGITALRYSYKKEYKAMQNVKDYRILGVVTIVIFMASIAIRFIVAKL